jgi:hypothetical protein
MATLRVTLMTVFLLSLPLYMVFRIVVSALAKVLT